MVLMSVRNISLKERLWCYKSGLLCLCREVMLAPHSGLGVRRYIALQLAWYLLFIGDECHGDEGVRQDIRQEFSEANVSTTMKG